jgi:hypothetical protein
VGRRPPARLRADTPPPGPRERIVAPDWLSPAGAAALAAFDRDRWWPVGLRPALAHWEGFLRNPYHRLWEPAFGCGEPGCCPDPAEWRAYLVALATVLPPRDARHLRRVLAELDERW